MAKLGSKSYGDALFEVAVEENKVDTLFEEAYAVREILAVSKELNQLMDQPKITKEDKIKIMEETFGERVSGEITGLIKLLITKGHYQDTVDVLDYFIGLVKEEKKIGIAYVSSAIALSGARKKEIEKKLLDTTSYESFEVHYEVDESLIGGMVIRIGDRVVDSSIKSKLYELTKELKKIQVGV